jgi:SAM-dependent methyltransferase
MESANTDYDALGGIFRGAIRSTDVLVDVGCGKGRVINWWLSRGYTNEIIGIEIDEEIAERTRRRLRRYRQVSIVCGDAIETLPVEGTLFYLFNPFREPIVEMFRDRLAELQLNDPGRQRRVLYYFPAHLCVFEHDARWEVVYRHRVPTLWSNFEVAGLRPSKRT